MSRAYLRIKIEMAKNLRYSSDLMEALGKPDDSDSQTANLVSSKKETDRKLKASSGAVLAGVAKKRKTEGKRHAVPLHYSDNDAATRIIKNFQSSTEMYNKVFPVMITRNGKNVGADCVKEDK